MNREPVHILLVDDQRGKLLSYQAILEDLGESLWLAQSSPEALEVLLKVDVALILLDVNMPELDGFQLLEMIRKHPRFEKTAILFVSGENLSERDYIRGYVAGAVDYVSVPLVPELLRAKVRVFAELEPVEENPDEEEPENEGGDGVADELDLCPDHPVSNPADADADGLGDVCDNCPFVANTTQVDGDGIGDDCDQNLPGDNDGDGLGNGDENQNDTDKEDPRLRRRRTIRRARGAGARHRSAR